ncbi:uncharacterized protein LOC131282488 [Anopheles ziemanni]|uniref:uncharacterized protein LOC131262915 n=1 Tax=Anopheles coustani TaxID=139045 RepID=UPI00265A57D6|nr:uncharacterized protein LOC131262915 [Anopheles coustani]XP_058167953.1 uncharacterized protein LOC131282488 [Anopheles ziemanni]
MSQAKVVVNDATDLLLVGDAVKDVPLKEITQAVLKGLCQQESDIGLYECLFTKVIPHFEPKEFEAEVSCIVLPELVALLEKIQHELQTNALRYFFVENLTILLRLADVLQKLIEYLVEQTERCQLFHTLVVFPEYLLRCYTIVRQNYATMAKESDVLEVMKTLYVECKKILMAFLDLLCPRDVTSRISYFRAMERDEEYACLEKVCTLLASVGNEITPIDSLLASDVWKAIVKLSTEHAGQLFTGNRTEWLTQIIITLNTGIDQSFNEIRMKNDPSKQVTISLKLNAFFLRVMLKFLSLLKPHATPEVFRPIIATLLHVKTSLRPGVMCSELTAGIDQYLHIGYMAIVESSLRSEPFAKEFCNHECKTTEDIYSYYSLLMHIVGQIVSNANDRNLVAIYGYRHNLLAYVCTLLKRSDSLLLHNASLYKQLLTNCSGLILIAARLKNRDAQKTIEESLVRMVLQEHYYTGLLGIDLWSVFVRYHSTQLLFGYFLFWKKINDHRPIFHTRPEQIFPAQLLRNLWVFLPATQKAKIIDKYPVSDLANDRLWAIVDLSGDIDKMRQNRFVESVEKRLVSGMNALRQRPSVEGFYETLTLISIGNNTPRLSGVAKEAKHGLWNTILESSEIWSTSTACSFFACLLTRETIPHSILRSSEGIDISDTPVFVKYISLKLIEKANPNTNLPTYVGSLLSDNCPLIAAVAFDVLQKLIDKQNLAVKQFLTKSPHIGTQLSVMQTNPASKTFPNLSEKCEFRFSVHHRCRSLLVPAKSDACGDITMIINSKIDELFPDTIDDDGDDDSMCDVDIGMLSDNVSEAKKRKIEDKERNAIESPTTISRCLGELEVQGNVLENLVQSQELEGPSKARLRRIISILNTVLDS